MYLDQYTKGLHLLFVDIYCFDCPTPAFIMRLSFETMTFIASGIGPGEKPYFNFVFVRLSISLSPKCGMFLSSHWNLSK